MKLHSVFYVRHAQPKLKTFSGKKQICKKHKKHLCISNQSI